MEIQIPQKKRSRIQTGEYLLQKGILTRDQLDLCLQAQLNLTKNGVTPRIGDLILDYGFANRVDVEAAIASSGGNSNNVGIHSIPMPLLKRVKAYPVSLNDGVLKVAAAGLLDETDKLDLISAATNAGLIVGSIEIEPQNRFDVLSQINKLSSPDKATVAAELAELENRIEDHLFINEVIEHVYVDALQSRASDIHFQVSNKPDFCWIIHRVDGHLRFQYMITVKVMSVLATRIKMDAGLDYTDTMRPHDGRTSFRSNGRQIGLRVSTLPVSFGESIVLRLLDSGNVPDLNYLFATHPIVAHHIGQIVDSKQKAGGVVLVTGATGSGKSTTLNAVIRAMDRSTLSIKTVEDPVEQEIPLVGHTQVNEAAGLTYPVALRALLRQDPDAIMVGELRDPDTIETALRAAETGHLMLSTLHTGNVSESYTRAIGMMNDAFRNIGKYIISNSIKAIVNQKLARRLCTKCVHEVQPDEKLKSYLIDAIGQKYLPQKFFESKGCERCEFTGYYGRVIMPEALFVSSSGKTRSQIESVLVGGGAFREIFDIDGVTFYSREQACASVLNDGVIDIQTALSVLDVHHSKSENKEPKFGRRKSDEVAK